MSAARLAIAVVLALAAPVVFAPAVFAKAPAPNKALHALFDREWKHDLDESPESATLYGIDGYDDRLTDYSPEAIARRKAHVKSVIARS